MRRVISSVVVLLILVAGLVACAPQAGSEEQAAPAPVEEKSSEGEVEDTASPAEPAGAEEEEASAEPAAEVTNPLKVVFLLPQTLSPFEIDMWNGIDQAKTDGIASEIKMIEMKEPTEFEQNHPSGQRRRL